MSDRIRKVLFIWTILLGIFSWIVIIGGGMIVYHLLNK